MPRPSTLPDAFTEAVDLAAAVRLRRVSPVELVEAVLERIARHNPLLNAYLAVFTETARRAARRAEAAVRRGDELGALHGVPVSIKDLVVSTEGPTTAGSRIFGAGVAGGRDAAAVRRLRRAGAIVLGKTNLHEVALGVTTVNEHFGPARNPWNRAHVAGGSSGGSAVAVAAGLGALSLGTDTRGSIRIPSACCGVSGLKPTRGLVPLDGILPLSTTLDHAGPMARSAADCALMLGVLAGGREADRFLRAAQRTARGMRVGVSEYHLRDLDPPVAALLDEALRDLERVGVRLRAMRIPALDEAQGASVRITAPEAYAVHEPHLRERPDGFGPMVRRRLEAGADWKAVEYLHARRTRVAVRGAFAHAFEEVDALVGAVLPVTPPRIEATAVVIDGREANLIDAFTRLNSPQNMAGIPALAVPCGFAGDGLPVALQVMAARGRDEIALRVGTTFQRQTDWHRRRPALG